MDQHALFYWGLATVYLSFKMFSNSIVQGVGRKKTQRFSRPEDARFFDKGGEAQEDAPIVIRAQNVWRNDLENIPMFLLMLLGFVLARGAGQTVAIYAGIFCFFRTLHTLFYLSPKQPHRFLSFICACTCMYTLAIHLVIQLANGI